jgi:multiple sugar transport system permease protein
MFNTQFDLLMAASVFALAPILVVYMLGQRYFVEGVVTSGIKG